MIICPWCGTNYLTFQSNCKNGQDHEGKVTTLNRVGDKLQEGKSVCILYLPTTPQWNSIYPHP
jgi:hypothetical protein